MTTVAAVVVTFNRKEMLTDCLKQLFGQTKPLDRIYVIDNCSTDGTREQLAALGYLDRPTLDYVLLADNTGGAGGFHEGMRRAYDDGYDWIWIMDDDCEPAANALELMSGQFDDPTIATVMPMIANALGEPDFVQPHRGFLRSRHEIGVGSTGRALTEAEAAGKALVDINYFSFVGPCFPRRVIDAIGLPLKEFFIHFDDIEYSQRVQPLGRSVVVMDTLIVHREAQTAVVATAKSATNDRIPYARLWLRYFGYRNRIWLITRGKLDAPLMPLLTQHLRILVGVLLNDDHKWRRFRFWNAALIDGFFGTFENKKPRSILGLD